MAKPRKPKNEETKVENSGAVVRHQKLCLSIDMEKHQIYGYTELEIAVPDIGIVGLHAENLGIESVLVDGEPTEFEYYPHNHQNVENEKRWRSMVSSPSSAADAAAAVYISALERELVPNLLINCCKPFKGLTDQIEQMNLENKLDSSAEPKQNVKLVRIDYWVEKVEVGIHFDGNALHTDNQIRRARCWFPCIDDTTQRCCYDLEFTVSQNLIAVSAGSLLYQVLSKDDPPRKTYVYRLDVPVSAKWITLAVAPFEVLPDHHQSLMSHICLPANVSKIHNTVEFFHNAFSHYETYLDAKFPFGSYKQVFLAPEMAVSSSTFGAAMGIFSSQILYDEKVIDQAIDTSIKLSFALARQWFGVYITPELPNDEWLLDGLAGFLTDSFIKKFLGNNEARYRRYKANCAVCKADDSGATALSSSASCKDLYGTQCIGIFGKIRSCKSVAILQMLEKQMGSNFFRKILQNIISRAQGASPVRTLSTKEFRHFANKVGNLERPFLKEFFPRWVGTCGCPVLRMGFSYNKRKNIVELAVLRDCTVKPDSRTPVLSSNTDSENRDGDIGWPGMMSIRVHELDGMYDHPILPMAGDAWQLLEIQCHSKLAARRALKPKKGSKPDGCDDNGDAVAGLDMRSSMESPLSWIRADPEMEYLAEIHFNQPVQMWINQLEKDGDVVAQAQAIAALEALPHLSFNVVNTLNNFLSDSKAFWRVRIEAAYALANTASEETDWAGLLHLVKFYKSRRFDENIGLPRPNDFHDFSEYFVLEAIPHAVAMVRAADNKSPREAVEFVLQLLKYNDNNGNPYSDVFWLAALVQSVGELEFGQQSILFLSSLLKRIDRLLQFDRLMPSYNGILTISCIRTLTQIALKLSGFISLDQVVKLIKPFRDFNTIWQVRVEASRALLDLEFHCNGIDSALSLFIKSVEEEPSLRGQVKLGIHAMRICQIKGGSDSNHEVDTVTLVALLNLLESRISFNNVFLRHHLFGILQILAGRAPTLYGVPRDKLLLLGDGETSEQKNVFASFVTEMRRAEPPMDVPNLSQDNLAVRDASKEVDCVANGHAENILAVPEASKDADVISNSHERKMAVPEASKEAETVSNSYERKLPVVKIRVKQSTATSRADEADNRTIEKSQGGNHENDRGASSSVSVDAPQRNSAEAVSFSNHNIEEVNSCHDHGSRMTASIGSAKLPSEGDNFGKELQCTADSSKVSMHLQPDDPSSPSIMQDNNVDADAQKFASLQTLSVARHDLNGKEKKEKKDREKKRNREDPDYLEKKRLKKEKKRKEKELAKLLGDEAKAPSVELAAKKEESNIKNATAQLKPFEPSGSKVTISKVAAKPEPSEGSPAPKFRIKIKSRTQN
ncbi:transcription initiation factor TFIID subunit 2 [Citrus sinensis]|uniref:transcription initiation factor TFIID subunit 2 isoform X1 n=1 Tax=Citrus sinensis TaxID=2711 RepID=UPI002193F08D|nr:transcription initiation factor TFIID subunit 2 isoform X1 [Citrus sinensis]KAH9722533.1 transcription initiation factor TFIID subunit 2 [Citrus sinensis]